MNERKVILSTESTCDLPQSYYEQHDVKIMRLTYSYGESEDSFTELDENAKTFYGRVRAGEMPRTSQIPMREYFTTFEEYIHQGYDIVHLSLSSGISGTFNSCCMAVKELQEAYPDANIYPVDSLSASMGEGLLLNYAVGLRDSGLCAQAIAERLCADRQKFCHYFTVDDLGHLQRGGRVSKLTAVLGTAFGIKPGLHVDAEGHLIPVTKIRGRKQSITWLADSMEKKVDREAHTVTYISHGDCLADAELLRDMIKERMGYTEFLISDIGPVIGSHSGPGTLALFFVGKNRNLDG